MIKTVIYDLDGTIISTAELHEEAWRSAAESIGVKLTKQMLIDQKGMSNDSAAKMMLGTEYSRLGTTLVKAKEREANAHIHMSKLFPGFDKSQEDLKNYGIDAWICTSADRQFTNKVFNLIPELERFRHKALAKEDYVKGKPDAEPILAACKRANSKVGESVYVGDAVNDYLAATAAGCKFIYFCPDARDERIPKGTPTIKSHSEILNLVKRL